VAADTVNLITLLQSGKGSVFGVTSGGDTSRDQDAGFSLRLAARPAQALLLRAHLRLWLTEQDAGEDEALDILVAATEAFNDAVVHARQPRSIAVHVEARNNHGVVEILIRDHGGWHGDHASAGAGLGLHLMHALMDTVEMRATKEGTTIRLRRALGVRRIGSGKVAIAPARDRLDLLWSNPIFAPLPGAVRERVAAQLAPVSASVDETIIREGDAADRFFLIAQGRLDVSAAGHHVATLGSGDHVGEIALLHQVPRTATIVAKSPVELYALTAEEFLAAVTPHRASRQAALNTAATRLAELEAMLGRTA
jgi:anti-sigma regulatory factor (Ser/Thr protein kinase)